MTQNALRIGFVLSILLLTASTGLTPLPLKQGPILLDGVAGAGEWDPGWQVTTDPLDVFIVGTGVHPHEPPTYARSGYDATGLWAHYDATGDTWYFRLDVDGRAADSDSQVGTPGNLGVGTHGNDQGPLVEPPFMDNDGLGPSEAYQLWVQYEGGGPLIATLGENSAILPGVVFPTTGDLLGQGVYSTTFGPGVLEWAFDRDVIMPAGSNHRELWLGAQMGDSSDIVSDDQVPVVLLIALDQALECPASPVVVGQQATFPVNYAVPAAAALGVNDVMLTVAVPTGTTFISASHGGAESGGLIDWTLGDLFPGAAGQVTFTLHIDEAIPSLTLDGAIVSDEGLRYLSSTECLVQETYQLTVNRVPEAGGVVNVVPDQAAYYYGDIITLTAAANPSWVFVGWSGDVIGASTQVTHTITSNTVVTATFSTYRVYLPCMHALGN